MRSFSSRFPNSNPNSLEVGSLAPEGSLILINNWIPYRICQSLQKGEAPYKFDPHQSLIIFREVDGLSGDLDDKLG